MLYIGYPVSIEEAYRLLGITIKDKLYHDQIQYINVYFKYKGVGICAYPIGKYCVMLSYECKEIEDVWNKHVSVTSFITNLQTINEKIKKDLETLSVDMSIVYLSVVEGDERIANNPEPIVWNWTD
jgi:hypothetical protein